jgi:hypothetical protein
MRALVVAMLVACGAPRDAASLTPKPIENRGTVAAPAAASCDEDTASDAAPVFRVVTIGRAEGVIVPHRRYPEASWTPTEVEVSMLESGLAPHLKANRPDESPRLYRKLSQYKRQYIGVCEEGRRILYAFFMCEAPPKWKEQVMEIRDGGDCYFSVHFDVATRRYLYVTVNGHA